MSSFKTMMPYFIICFLFFSNYLWADIKINPKGTYLFKDFFFDTKAEEATALLLDKIQVKEKDKIELSFYSPTRDVKQVLAVFSDNSDNFINLTEEYISPESMPTKQSKITTDIYQDFSISSDNCTVLTIPQKADRILFSLNDSFFSDNENTEIYIKAEKVLFQIKEKTIYQAVNSPKQSLKDYFEAYDLVKNKATVLKLVYEKIDNISSSSHVFKPVIKINGISQTPKCFDEINKKEKDCNFTLNSFDTRGLLEQTVILPMGENEALDKEGSFEIDLGFENQKCKSSLTNYSFSLNIHETRKLQIGFTLIKGISSSIWEDFIESSLKDFELLKKIYPVPDIGDNTPQWIFLNQQLKTDENSKLISSSEDRENSLKIIQLEDSGLSKPSNLHKDLVELKKIRIRQQLGKLFAIADKEYFGKLYKDNVVGFVVFTENNSATENVGFVRIDQGGTGTILHELGHLLGQHNEFYRKSNQNIEKNDICRFERVDYCFQFTNFKGFYGSLKEGYENWKFVTREKSIMGSSSDLNKQWIDRETYGKALKTLSDPKQDPELLIFSGIFNQKDFIDPELEYLNEGYLTPDNSEGDLEIKILDKNSKELHTLKISTKVSIEFIDTFNKLSTTESLSPVPIAVALPFYKESKELIVVEKSTGKKIYSQNLDEENIIISSEKPDLSNRRVFE